MDDITPINYVEYLYDEGLMDEYSSDHFIIKALKGEMDYINKHPNLFINDYLSLKEYDLASTFIFNFSKALWLFAQYFPKCEIENFVKNQLAAGKENYSEEQFFRAVSEIHVINYILLQTKENIKKCTYEPRLNGQSNPEARIELKDGTIIDIEVKTPGFPETIINPTKARVKPNFILEKNIQDQLIKYCKLNKLELAYPRVLKLREYIKSAAKKFNVPTGKRHYNLLFINWTYTDFPECELAEPITLLVNSVNGLFVNKKAHGLINIKDEHINKISSIILFKDNINNLLFGRFDYHFQDKSCVLIQNQTNKQYVETGIEDVKYLEELLNMEIYNNQPLIEWWAADTEWGSEEQYVRCIKAISDIENMFLNEYITYRTS